MELFLAVVPAFAWGSIGLLSNKLGGTAYQQTFGMTIGAFLFSAGVYVVYRPVINYFIIIVGFLSGLLWAVGQHKQFQTMQILGVSNTLPISTGLQLIVNTLAGVLLFREWTNIRETALGILALAALMLGVYFTTVSDGKESIESAAAKKAGIKAVLISTAGYASYTILINATGVDSFAVILPQSVGMYLGASLFSIKQPVKSIYTLRNSLTGLLWALGNVCMLISMKNIGLAVAFSLSQTGIIISTLGGIWLLGETKTKREFRYILFGCLLVIGGGVMLGYLKA